MIIGCPTEVKNQEQRVGLIPSSTEALVKDGHTVLIQKGAGVGSCIPDLEYKAVGAEIVDSAKELWERSELIVKVKEPVASEYDYIGESQALYTFLHLAAEPELTKVLLDKKVTSIAYETIQVGNTLPLLRPSSEVAGRMAVQVGSRCLERKFGGKGILLSGATGVCRGKVAIIGGGIVGANAAKMAVGLGADVTILDTNLDRLEYLDNIFQGRVHTLFSNPFNISTTVTSADLVIGAVLVPGGKAPKLVTKEHVRKMGEGSVIVDVAVDQGGCVETMKPTTHDDPTYIVDGVVHYGVSNMPGAVPQTSTFALANATLPFLIQLAKKGVIRAPLENSALKLGVNTHAGHVTYEAVAKAHGLEFKELAELV